MNDMTKRCIYCGSQCIKMKVVQGENRRWNIFFPRAIYKWIEELVDYDRYKYVEQLLESKSNRGVTHFSCNMDKDDTLPDVDSLYIDEDKKTELVKLIAEIQPEIDMFKQLKLSVLRSQDFRCAVCGKYIDTGTIHRKNGWLLRTEDNACIICHSCSRQGAKFTKIRGRLFNT